MTTYMMERFSFNNFTDYVRNYSITDIAIVPKILTALLTLPIGDTSLHSLRYILCAGAPISAKVQQKLYDHLSPEAVIAQNWGATELGWVSMFEITERDTTGSIGRLLPGVDLKLVDTEGQQVSLENVPGEALIRSPSMFLGYLGKIEANSNAFDEEGFYRTGDLLHMENGKLFYHDRVKDTMKVNGWQVTPTELEQILTEHPLIADAAVVGVKVVEPSGLEDTHPKAFVVARQTHLSPSKNTKNDILLTEDEVKGFVAARVARFKRLEGGVQFVDEIPRNSGGKILRRELLSR